MHEIEQYLAAKKIDGLIETSPGVRSVVIEYDQRRLPLPKLLEVRAGAQPPPLPCYLECSFVMPPVVPHTRCMGAPKGGGGAGGREPWRASAGVPSAPLILYCPPPPPSTCAGRG